MMMNTRLLVAVFCMVCLLGVSSIFAVPAPAKRIDAVCSVANVTAVCGDDVWFTCNVVDYYEVFGVNFVKFIVNGAQYSGSLLSGTRLNGTWGVSIQAKDTFGSALTLTSVGIVDSANHVCGGDADVNGDVCTLTFGTRISSLDCTCTFVASTSCNIDNTGMIMYTSSAGCTKQSYSVNSICDYCDPQWTASYTGCVLNTTASIGDPFLGVAKKSYTSGNPGCCLSTGLESDCKPSLDDGSNVACVQDYWTAAGRDLEGTSTTYRPKQLTSTLTSCTDVTSVEVDGEGQPIRPLVYDFDRDGTTETVVFTSTGFKVYTDACYLQNTVSVYPGGWEGSASMVGINAMKNNYQTDTVTGPVVDSLNSTIGFAALATNSASPTSISYFVVYAYNTTTSSWVRLVNLNLTGYSARNSSVHCVDWMGGESCIFMLNNNKIAIVDPVSGNLATVNLQTVAQNMTNLKGHYAVFGSNVAGVISVPNMVVVNGVYNQSGVLYNALWSCDYPSLNGCNPLLIIYPYNSSNVSDIVMGLSRGDGSVSVYVTLKYADGNGKSKVDLITGYAIPGGWTGSPVAQTLVDTTTTVIDCVSDPVRARCMPNIEGIGLLTHYNVTSSSAPVTQGAYTLLMSKSADIVFGGRGVLLPKIGAYAVAGQGSTTSFTVQIFRISDGFLLSTITIGVGGLYSPAGIGITAEADGSYLYIAYGAYRQYYGKSYTLKVYKINSESSIQFMGDTSAGSATDVWLVAPQKVYSGGLVRTIHPDNITNVNPTYSSVLTAPDWFDRDALKVGYGANIYNYSLSTYTRTGLVATSTLGNLGTYNGDRASPLFYTSTGYLVSADSNFQSLTQIGIKNPFDTGSNPGFIELSGVVPSLKQEFIPGYIYNNSKIYTAYTDYSDGLNPEYHREPSAAGVPIYSATRMAYTALSSSTNVMLVSSYYLNQPGVASVKYWTYNSGASSGGETPVVVPYDEYACYVTNAGVTQKVWSKTEPSGVCKRSITAFDTNGDFIDELVSANGVYGANKKYYSFAPVTETNPAVVSADVNSDSFMDFLFLIDQEFKIIKSNPIDSITLGTSLSVGGAKCEYSTNENKINAVATGISAKYPTTVSVVGKLYQTVNGRDQLIGQYTPQWGVNQVVFTPSKSGEYRVDLLVKDEQARSETLTTSCNVTVPEIAGGSTIVGGSGCGFGADGEFNYDDSVWNHNWYPMSNANEPTMMDNQYAKFTKSTTEIVHSINCYDETVEVDIGVKVGSSGETKFVIQGEDNDGQSSIIGGIVIKNSVLYMLTAIGLTQVGTVDTIDHEYAMFFNTKTQRYYVQIDGGTVSPEAFFVSNLVGEFTVVDVLHTNGTAYVDYIRVGGATGTKRIVVRKEDAALLPLLNCNGVDNRSFTTQPVGTFDYPNVESYCNGLYRLNMTDKKKGINYYCSYSDLQRAIKYNRLCYKEAYDYCVAVTFPQTGGFDESGKPGTADVADMSAGSSACLIALTFTAATDTIATPITNVMMSFVKSHLLLTGLFIGLIVIMGIFAMKRR